MALPRLLGSSLLRLIEIQQAGLSAGVEIHLQCIVVLPCDMHPARLAHDPADAKSLALEVRLAVSRQIPIVRHANSFLVQRKAFEVTLSWSRHAMAPVFADDRHPVAGGVNRSNRACRLSAPLPARLRTGFDGKADRRQG